MLTTLAYSPKLQQSLSAVLGADALVSDRLNQALRDALANACDVAGVPAAADAMRVMAPVDIAAVQKETVRAFVAAVLARSSDAAVRASAASLLPKLSDQTTLAQLLGLDQPLASHPLFNDLARRAQLATLAASDPSVTPAQQQAFVEAWAAHTGTVEDFWTSLRKDATVAPAVDALQQSMVIGWLVQNHPPLVAALQAQRKSGAIKSVRDLARYTSDDWLKMIGQSNVPLPAGTPGIDRDQQSKNLAQRILRQLHAAYPTAYLSAALAKSTDAIETQVSRALANAPTLELRDAPLDTALTDAVFAGVTDRATVTEQLGKLQRLMRLTSDETAVLALHRAGLGSAHHVARTSEAVFVNSMASALGGPAAARAIHQRAQAIVATSAHTALSVLQGMRDPLPQVIGAPLTNVPHWATLFGSLSYCDCDDCQSIHGPAAYFVDILQFLNPKTPPPSGTRPIDVLFKRRPDLQDIPLTCANAETPMPYADLVNEILESFIATGAPAAHDTDGATADELAVMPAFTNDAAYATLQQSVYPPSLPFERSLEVQRTYLEYAGSSRWELRKLLMAPSAAAPVDLECESQHISALEHQILVGATAHVLPDFYGYRPSDNIVVALAAVPELLRRTSLAFPDLVTLLGLHFVNPGGTVTIQTAPGAPCDIAQMQLEKVDLPFFERFHRFVRLWRKLGWDATDVNRALDAVSNATPSTLDDTTLPRVMQLARLKTRLKASVPALCALVANISTAVYDPDRDDSTYAALFQNKKLMKQGETAFNAFSLNATRTELADTSPTLRSVAPAILQALKITGADLAALTSVPNWPTLDSHVTLANLSALYRAVVLGKGLQLRMQEVASLVQLVGADPFPAHDPSVVLSYVTHGDTVKASGMSVAQLDYLYRSAAGPLGDPATPPALQLQRKLQTGLAKLSPGGPEAISFVKQALVDDLKLDGPTIDLLVTVLVRSVLPHPPAIPPPPVIVDFLALVGDGASATYFANNDLTGNSVNRIDPTIDFDWATGVPDPSLQAGKFSARWTGFLSVPYDESFTFFVHTHQGIRLTVAGQLIIDAWTAQPPAAERSGFVALKSGQLYPFALEFHADANPAAVQLSMSSQSLKRAVVSQSSLYSGNRFSTFNLPLQSYRRLYKLAQLVSRLRLDADELRYLHDHSGAFADFSVSLPVTPPQFSSTQFAAWERVAAYVAQRDVLPSGGDVTLLDVFAAANDPATTLNSLAPTLAQATTWDPTQIAALVATGTVTVANFKSEIGVAWTAALIALAHRVGVTTAELIRWGGADLSGPDGPVVAADLRRAIAARFDEGTDATAVKGLNDGLREKSRDALVAALANDVRLADADHNGPDQLFAWFLIDVEMSACMMTSRLKQAISSVQLFVDRCLLGLEPSVAPGDIDADTWKWKKSYRIWEANQKIFLYPENWIDPELRDDRSVFFKQLQAELRQNPLTTETTEDAVTHYLESLYEAARLDIAGMFWEQDDSPQIWVGDYGPSVVELQQLLDDAGIQPPLDLTGLFDWNTMLALLFYEWTHGHQLGPPDAGTWSALRGGRPPVNVMHVVGRTYASPYKYYYRRFEDGSTWTPWEPINVDIQSDHVVPVVWNGRLHLFWPIIDDKSPPNPTPIEVQYQVRLGWSVLKNSGFSAKKETPKDQPVEIRHVDIPFPAWSPTDLVQSKNLKFRPELNPDGSLTIHFAIAQGDRRSIGTPWPDFVEGFWPVADFRFIDAGGRVLVQRVLNPDEAEQFMLTPPKAFAESECFGEGDGVGNFTISTFYQDSTKPIFNPFNLNPTEFTLFKTTPTRYRMAYSQQYFQYYLQAPFFYQDDQRNYFVTPFWIDPERLFPKLDSVPPILPSAALTATSFSAPAFAPLLAAAPHVTASASAASTVPTTTATSTITPSSPASSATPGAQALVAAALATDPPPNTALQADFEIHYHPFVLGFFQSLAEAGVPGLLSLSSQRRTDHASSFEQYSPTIYVYNGPVEQVDFGINGSYSGYNWEIFFHIPLLIATRLTADQQFDEAQKWLHYIFDPTDHSGGSSPQRFWKTLPFANNNAQAQQIEALLLALDGQGSGGQLQEIQAELAAWHKDPFNPDAIARIRLVAYQKCVVMKYLDNLIAWGDSLFQEDTIESINEATQLYILARNILGKRPEKVPGRGDVAPQTYRQLQPTLDAFSNALVQLENKFPYQFAASPAAPGGSGMGDGGMGVFYFCIQANAQLLAYWDTVEDRLFKIRHCLNIQGVAQQLPLFEPPIDPALLVRAKALGLDISSVLSDVNAPTPLYRFPIVLQKAVELCNEVRSFGATLLGTLEKKDAEGLAALRASQETGLLQALRDRRQQSINEAQIQMDALDRARDVAQARLDYYSSRVMISTGEQSQLDSLADGNTSQGAAGDREVSAQDLNIIPSFSFTISQAGTASGTSEGTSWGGPNLGAVAEARARYFQAQAAGSAYEANRSAILAGYGRRQDDWTFQSTLATRDLAQIERQHAAAEVRYNMAVNDLDTHDLQIENASAIEDYLRNKFSNQDLYEWMVSQLAAIYFQSYQMAYAAAKRAEQTFRFDRAIADSSYIQFGYWDGLHKGLLAGEQLSIALRRLEAAYLDSNQREYELTKDVSLVMLAPDAFIALRETGQCRVLLPEALFDMDYPGQYLRRLKHVSITIPCVVGPYTGIRCKLTLENSRIRLDPTSGDGGYAEDDGEDPRFTYDATPRSIVTSHGQADGGMFDVSFRDDRYLPFEGLGAVSQWRIELPPESNAFDLETITDVVLRLSYTAREGGDSLRKVAQAAAQLPAQPALMSWQSPTPRPDQQGLVRLFSLKHEYSAEWYRFTHPAPTADTQVLTLAISQERFPLPDRARHISITGIELMGVFDRMSPIDPVVPYAKHSLLVSASAPSGGGSVTLGTLSLDQAKQFANAPYAAQLSLAAPVDPTTDTAWTFTVRSADIATMDPMFQKQVTANGQTFYRLNTDAFTNLLLLVHYDTSG